MEFFYGNEFTCLETALDYVRGNPDMEVVEVGNQHFAASREEIERLIKGRIPFRYWCMFSNPICSFAPVLISVPVS